jgi:hypothetical protein
MKKFFTLVMALVAVMAVNATVVTLNPGDFTAVTTAAAIDQTVNGIRVQIGNGMVNSSHFRVYKDKTLTITAESAISGIVMNCDGSETAQYGPGLFAAQEGYSYKGTVGTWVGTPATSVVFTATAQVRVARIQVYLDGEVPSPEEWNADTISVTEANALVADGDMHDHYVIGVVMGAPFNTFSDFSGSVSFWMSDVANPTDSIEFYQGTGEGGAKWASLLEAQEILHEGDTVMVYAAQLKPYTKGDVTISEITGGYYVEMIGANPNPPVVEYEELTVAEAIAIAQALSPEKGKSKSTNQIYDVYGYVVGISTTKENTFYLADQQGVYGEFQAYQCSQIDYEVAEGDYVVVTGPITHYFGYDKQNPDDESKYYHNYEISGGILEHAVAPEGIENVVLTEKAQKVMVDGVMYIVRDNKMFDVRGAQVR